MIDLRTPLVRGSQLTTTAPTTNTFELLRPTTRDVSPRFSPHFIYVSRRRRSPETATRPPWLQSGRTAAVIETPSRQVLRHTGSTEAQVAPCMLAYPQYARTRNIRKKERDRTRNPKLYSCTNLAGGRPATDPVALFRRRHQSSNHQTKQTSNRNLSSLLRNTSPSRYAIPAPPRHHLAAITTPVFRTIEMPAGRPHVTSIPSHVRSPVL